MSECIHLMIVPPQTAAEVISGVCPFCTAMPVHLSVRDDDLL